jgi:hypothetical protein
MTLVQAIIKTTTYSILYMHWKWLSTWQNINLIYCTIIQIKFFNCFWRFGYLYGSHYQRRITVTKKLQLYHRVETYRAVTDRCKRLRKLTFSCTHFFSGDRAKNDQLRVLSKFKVSSHQVVIRSSSNQMHASSNLPSMRTKKWVH